MNGPLPVQVCTWLSEQSGYQPSKPAAPGASDGEWLFCLKHTKPGDRQVVWSGVGGSGIIAVVDFSGEVRPRAPRPGTGRASNRQLSEGWGRLTELRRPVSVALAQSHPVLQRRFGRSIQSVWSIEAEVAQAISVCAGGLPPAADFHGFEADWRQPGGLWGRASLPPEAIVEEIVLNEDEVARRLGFPSPVNPNGGKVHLSNGRIPDLWCSAGVVGEVKNQVTARRGPDQIEDYIAQCDTQWSAHQWRGVLVQGEPEMAPNALPRLKTSRYRDRLQVWTVRQESTGRIAVELLFP